MNKPLSVLSDDVRPITAPCEKRVDLRGKVAVVTGAARGIGASIVRRLAARGADIVFTYRASRADADHLTTLLRDREGTTLAIQADSGKQDDVCQVFRAVAERFRRVDILVNNAGLAHQGEIDQFDLARFDEMMAVNIRGAYMATREAAALMPRGGRIVNIGSVSSDYAPYAGIVAYVMTKSALHGMTRGLARELGQRGITINTVQPGRIDTRMLRSVLADRYEQARATMPLGRFGDSDEVASLVEYLCSEGAAFITGANLRIDGGVSV